MRWPIMTLLVLGIILFQIRRTRRIMMGRFRVEDEKLYVDGCEDRFVITLY